MRLLLVNRCDEPVVVTDMAVQVDRRPAPTGTLGASPGGDPSPVYVTSFDLGKENPVAQLVDDTCGSNKKYSIIYVDNSSLSTPNEKHDCLRQPGPPC